MIVFIRDHARIAGLKGTHGETGLAVVGPWSGPILERADGRVRLPLGKYTGLMTRTNTKKIRAIRFVKTDEATLAAMGPKCRESFGLGHVYVHGVARVDASEQLEGCVGIPDIETFWAAIGGWEHGRQFDIEIKEATS